jgi:hypothetical protein
MTNEIKPPLFQRMVTGYFAEVEAEKVLEKILGLEWDTLTISWDYYDESFELFCPEDVDDIAPTEEQHAQIMALGCHQYWINFKDATERFMRGPRKPGSATRWRMNDEGEKVERRRALELPSVIAAKDARIQEMALQALVDQGQWIEHTGKLQDRINELESRLSALEAGSDLVDKEPNLQGLSVDKSAQMQGQVCRVCEKGRTHLVLQCAGCGECTIPLALYELNRRAALPAPPVEVTK